MTMKKTYHIEIKDGTGCFHFFTKAANHKKALKRLETSLDFKGLVKADSDLAITVKLIKNQAD